MFTAGILPAKRAKFLILVLIAIQIEEKQCAVVIDVVTRWVTATEAPSRANRDIEIRPLMYQVRRDNIAPTSASSETQDLGEVLQSIHASDPKLLHLPSDGESGEENKSNFQYFQNLYQALVKKLETEYKYGRNWKQDQKLQKDYSINEQYLKYRDYFQNLQQVPDERLAQNPVYDSFLQLLQYRNFVNNDGERVGFEDDNQNVLDDVGRHTDLKSKSEVIYIPIVKTYGPNKKEYSREVLKDLSLEQPDRYPENKHRHRRWVDHYRFHNEESIKQLPPPEYAEGKSRIIIDNDIYYDDPKHWPYPPDGYYHHGDPRHPYNKKYWNDLLWQTQFVPQKFINDDYQPFLGPYYAPYNPYPPKSMRHAQEIFLSQAIPLLKSMIFGTGIEQGPKSSPFRVHWLDLGHYGQWAHPPPPGPRMSEAQPEPPTEEESGHENLDLTRRAQISRRALSNSAVISQKVNKKDKNRIHNQEKRDPKNLFGQLRNGKSMNPEKNKPFGFDIDMNKNYTLILKTF